MERGAFEEAAITARHRLFSPIEAELLASVRIEDTYIAVVGGFVNDRSGNYAIVALKSSADPTDTTPAVLYQSPPASYSPDTTYRMYQFTPHVPDAEPFSMAVHVH